MKIQQLRYLVAIHENDLNITAAARQLHASQPGVSREIKLLEEELGLPLFERSGRALTRMTAAGADIIGRAGRILREVHNIHQTSANLRRGDGGTLAIATTHMQARYVLPEVVRAFRAQYPRVRLHLHQGTAEQIAELVAHDRVDFAIASGPGELFPRLIRLPVYRWRRTIVIPRGHALEAVSRLTLKRLAAYPIITYVFGYAGPSSLQEFVPARGGVITRVETLGGRYLYAIQVHLSGETFDLYPADICRTASGQSRDVACVVETSKAGLKVEGYQPPAAVIDAVERIAQAAGIDVGGIEYLVDDRDGEIYYYDINALSNFVADVPRVVGFDPLQRLANFLADEVHRAG